MCALNLYAKHEGPRKLHYFDAFHIAIARQHGLPIITSDNYINEHQDNLEIMVYN
ncbi:MAG: PIN domain-containing protein [Nitrososphaeria archaeon]|nr:PIN domain-containing protein [Nitrososphaeria archaeon]